jgi:cytochrome c-type biogenesis protein CcmH
MAIDRRSRTVGWLLVLAVALGIVAVAAIDDREGPANNGERVYALAEEFACPVCGGQSIAESDVPIAREIKREIRVRLDQGQTDAQIRGYLGNLYPGMDLRPNASGATGLVWFLPVFAFVLAIGGLAAVFRRWQTEPSAVATDADRALVDDALARAHAGTPTERSDG